MIIDEGSKTITTLTLQKLDQRAMPVVIPSTWIRTSYVSFRKTVGSYLLIMISKNCVYYYPVHW